MIRRRGVYHIAGYDPIGASWYRLFKRELGTFRRTWNVNSDVSALTQNPQSGHPNWTVTSSASNWRVETIYEPLLWDDIVRSNSERPTVERLIKSLHACADFIGSGALFGYFKANWQYGLFFLYPFVMLAAFLAVAFGLAFAVVNLAELPRLVTVIIGLAFGAALFAALLRWPGRRWRLQQGLDDSIFSWDYVYGRRPDVDARLNQFADELVSQARRNDVDEMIIVGHSLGGTLAIEVIARALARDPDFGRRGPSICLLTVGSTIPKFTLHPAGERFRAAAVRIVAEPAIAWAEYHARADAISFYKFNPVTLRRFYGDRREGKPLFRRVYIHQMLQLRTYLRYRLRFMRLHYQFVMANERRSTYDYFMLVCGPVPFAHSVLAAAGPAELFAPDGALIDPAAPAVVMPLAADAVPQNEAAQ